MLLVTSSDLIGSLASGMTLKFFSLFFMQICGLSPAAVSAVGAVAPLGIAAASLAAQRASRVVGRVQLNLATRAVDICLLVAMAFLPTSGGSARQVSPGSCSNFYKSAASPATEHRRIQRIDSMRGCPPLLLPAPQALVAVHLVRYAAANCTRPLLRSVLMERVPKRWRGKANAADSIRTFSWSGSAALGGWLVERLGFQGTFLVTAGVKAAAYVPLIALLAYVPDGICAGGAPPGAAAAATAAGYAALDSSGPLASGAEDCDGCEVDGERGTPGPGAAPEAVQPPAGQLAARG